MQEGLSTASLIASGDAWLLEVGLLANLDVHERERLLERASWREYPAGSVIIPLGVPARGVDLLVDGEVSIFLPQDGATVSVPLFRLGPGHLLGERSVLRKEATSAEVRAVSDVRALHLPSEELDDLLQSSAGLSHFLLGVVEVRERIDELLDRMLENPVLRSLGRGDLVRFVQSGSLVQLDPNDKLVSAGDVDGDVFVVISGEVAVYAPADARGHRQRLATNGPGWFFGHAAMLLKTPRTADIEAVGATEVLRVREATFRDLVAKNPALQRRLMSELATLDLRVADVLRVDPDAFLVGVCSLHRGHDAETVAYGIAGSLLREGPVQLLDMRGEETARHLRRPVEEVVLYGIPCRRLNPSGPLAFSVFWPVDASQTEALARAFEADHGPDCTLVVSAQRPTEAELAFLKGLDALVLIRNADEEFRKLPARRGQKRVEVVRIPQNSTIPVANHPGTVRLLHDPEPDRAFWSGGDPRPLADGATITGRAMARTVRALRGRLVGVALGGGGALGYAHIGLLRALHDADIPVDMIAGASFGSIVGGTYAAGGLDAVDELVERCGLIGGLAAASLVTLTPFTVYLGRLTEGRHLGNTEIPFMPVSLDVTTGLEFVPLRGTVAQGVRASAAMPGVFPSVANRPGRLVDGGMINNVPASVVWDAGAHFIIGSNVIPWVHTRRSALGLPRPIRAVYQRTFGRVDDLLHSLYMMMARIGRDRANLADYVFNLECESHGLNHFHRGDEVLAIGEAQAREQVQRIQEAYARDRLVPDAD